MKLPARDRRPPVREQELRLARGAAGEHQPEARSTAPASTTGRVPNRSLTAPRRNRGAHDEEVERHGAGDAARVQPVACVIGWRKTASDIMAPTRRSCMRAPIATITSRIGLSSAYLLNLAVTP